MSAMAKTPPPASSSAPKPTPKKPPVDPDVANRHMRFARERHVFLTTKDLALAGLKLEEEDDRSNYTRELKRSADLAEVKYQNFVRLGHIPLEAEEMAMKEVIRPESQTEGPILAESRRGEVLAMLAEWRDTPGAKPYVG